MTLGLESLAVLEHPEGWQCNLLGNLALCKYILLLLSLSFISLIVKWG